MVGDYMALCKDCISYAEGRCKKYKTSIPNASIETDCKHFSDANTPISKPKGVQIRDNKRKKNNVNMRQIKSNHTDICRFVQFEYMTFKQVNGKTRPDRTVVEVGLQIANKIFLNDGKYKFVNNKNLRIKKIFDDIPDAATEQMKELYKKYNN